MNVHIEYDGTRVSFGVEHEWDCCTLVDKILSHLHLYIYAVQTIKIVLVNGTEFVIGEPPLNWSTVPSYDERIELIIVEPRDRDADDKVLPSAFVDSYVAYQQQRDDERIAREMQEVDYGLRRPDPDSNGARTLFNRVMVDTFLDAIDREIEARAAAEDEDEDEEDEDGAEPRNPVTMRFLAPGFGTFALPIGPLNGEAGERTQPQLGNIFQRLIQAMRAGAPTQEDVKIVCTEEELAECPVLLYKDIVDKKGTACSISLEDFEEETEVMMLPECGHYFIPEHITTWLTQNSNKCPVCRVPRGKGKPLESSIQPTPEQAGPAMPPLAADEGEPAGSTQARQQMVIDSDYDSEYDDIPGLNDEDGPPPLE